MTNAHKKKQLKIPFGAIPAIITTLATILAMVGFMVNLWLATSVQPLATQIVELQIKAESLDESVKIDKQETNARLDRLDSRFDRIENKIDNILLKLGGN